MRIGLDFYDVIVYCILRRLLEAIGIDEVVIGRLLAMAFFQRWFWKITRVVCFFIKPVEGAIECINSLIKGGHKIIIVTSCDELGLNIAKQCIRRMFGYDLEIVGVGYKNSKAVAAIKFRLDVFVDNDLFKLTSLIGYVPHLFLFRDQHVKESEYCFIEEVFSWQELFQEISAFSARDKN